jgi:hypothetical protein
MTYQSDDVKADGKVSRNRCKDCGIFLPCKKHNDECTMVDKILSEEEKE